MVTSSYTALIGAVAMSLALPFYWVTPGASDLLLMMGMGFAAAIAHIMIALAFERAEASLLAPYGYAEIVTATAIGFYIFGDFPDPWTWVGIATVIASGVYISATERRRS